MWYIKVTVGNENYWVHFNDKTGMIYVTPLVLIADAFGPRDLITVCNDIKRNLPWAKVETVECSTNTIIPETMRKVMGL